MDAITKLKNEDDFHELVRRTIERMHEHGTKEHKEFTQELLTSYNAANALNKDKKTYPQNWAAYNEAQQKEKILLMQLLDELLCYVKFPEEKHTGRTPFPRRDRIFYLIMQAYNVKSSRRCISDLEIAKKFNYVSKTPHFNSILGIQKDPTITAFLNHLVQISGLPLQRVEKDFAVDSSGFSTSIFGRWFDVRKGTDTQKRMYKKAHLTCGVITNIITAVKITPGTYNDSPELPSLVNTTKRIFDVREVSADKGYISKDNLEAIWDIGAIPFIPFKSNVSKDSVHKNGFVWQKMLRFYTEYPEEFYHHYHKRSNIESTFNMLKSKFGRNLRSRTETGQTNEILAKCLCHNLCVLIQEAYELNIEINFEKCAEQEIAQKDTENAQIKD